MVDHTNPSFDGVQLATLVNMTPDEGDRLPFGVIGLDRQGIAQIYNRTEANLAGLEPETVLGQDFFGSIAQCMNNFMVAQRFEDEPELDATLHYVLTLRMRPTPVRMRLLASADASLRFILIER